MAERKALDPTASAQLGGWGVAELVTADFKPGIFDQEILHCTNYRRFESLNPDNNPSAAVAHAKALRSHHLPTSTLYLGQWEWQDVRLQQAQHC